jgi:hypothetical protein
LSGKGLKLLMDAVLRVKEETDRVVEAAEYLEEYEEAYLQAWTNYVVGGHITGRNETERSAREAELMEPDRKARNGARVRLRRAELYLAVAEAQLAAVMAAYRSR